MSDQWISVEDRLPDPFQMVNVAIVRLNLAGVGNWTRKYTRFIWMWPQNAGEMEPTHWQPLPHPPEKDVALGPPNTKPVALSETGNGLTQEDTKGE